MTVQVQNSSPLNVTTAKTLFSGGCLREYGNNVTLDLLTTSFLITWRSFVNSRCQLGVHGIKVSKEHADF